MQSWSTDSAPRGARAVWWNALFAERFAHVSFCPAPHREFAAELAIGSVGPVDIARIRATPAEIERTSAHIGRDLTRRFSFIHLARGSGQFEHNGNVAELSEGDFTLCDNAVPHRLRSFSDTELIVMRTMPEVIRERIPRPEDWCGLRLPATSLFAAAAASMAGELCAAMAAEQSLPGARLAAHTLLDVLATAFAAAFEPRGATTGGASVRRLHARRLAEANLRDPRLSTASVAMAMRVSPRYLRTLFQEESESLSAYIQRRRLEECRNLLENPLWSDQRIAAICQTLGFRSAAHFSRAFQARYGATPTGFRRRALRDAIP